MARALDLVEVPIADAVDRTLDTTPDVRKYEVVVPKHLSDSFRHSGVLPPSPVSRWLSAAVAPAPYRRPVPDIIGVGRSLRT
jgi:hypothetical protein